MSAELWAIDPGGYDAKQKTTGVAIFKRGQHARTAELVSVESMHAPILLGRLMDETRRPTVVYEGWRTSPFRGGGSTEPTAQTIGAIRWICDYRNLDTTVQQNTIKPRGLAMMARNGIELTGKNQHQRDAVTHGWYFILSGRNL